MKKKFLISISIVAFALFVLSSCRAQKKYPHCPAYKTQIELEKSSVNG